MAGDGFGGESVVSRWRLAIQHEIVQDVSKVAGMIYLDQLIVRQDAPESSGSYMETKKLIVLK
ncbi:MAG: hypothetical protein IIA61_05450 [Candidatus Marinimicrobia bacterium]|nr:hypothetical protein [Candidatus Neomarinimicrobiota bacterium]